MLPKSGAICGIFMFLQFSFASNVKYLPPLRLQDTAEYKTCERTYNSERFTIIVPKKDPAELFECRFLINSFAPDVCRLKVNFRKFEVAGSPGCRDQFLRIGGKRLCGSIVGTQVISLAGGSTVLIYRANGENALEIDIEQQKCQSENSILNNCDVVSNNMYTEISSPNYPALYKAPITCLYKVVATNNDTCGGRVRFLDFNVPDSPNCLMARLLLNGKSYCGQKSGVIVPVNMTNELQFDFAAGSGLNSGAFRISVEQLPCGRQQQIHTNESANQLEFLPPSYTPTLCCNRVFNAPRFILASPGFLDLTAPTNMECIYQIAPASPRTCRLIFTFIHFWLGQEDVYYNCLNGFLEIDGRRWCGCKDGLTVETYFDKNRKDLYFTMQGGQNKGFLIEVKQEECDFRVPQGKRAPDPEEVTRRPDTEVEVFSTNSTVEKVKSRFFVPREDSRCFQWGLPHWLDKVRAILQGTPCVCPAPPPKPPNFPPQNPILPPNYPPVNPILPPNYPQYPPQNPIAPPNYPRPPPQNPILPPNYPQSPPQNPIAPPNYPPPPPQNPILPPNYPQYPPQNPIAPPNYPRPPPQNPILPPNYPQSPPQNPIAPPNYPRPPPQSPPQIPISPPNYPPQYPISPPNYPQSPPQNPIAPPNYPWPPQIPIFPSPPQNPIAPPSYPLLPPQNPISPPNYPPQCPIPNPPVLQPILPISPRCRIFNDLKGNIQSPGYPFNYPPDQNCCFRIRRIHGFCSVELIILDFDINWSPKCLKDYLLLNQRERYCSRTLQSTATYLPFSGDFASIDFVSDSFFSGRGFRLVYQQIPCNAPPYVSRNKPESRWDEHEKKPRPEPYPHPHTTDQPIQTTTKFELGVTLVR